jgi:hypothetical protein
MDKSQSGAGTGCCPRFDPAPWNEKEVEFQDKVFVKDRVRSLFHIPVNFGRVMTRNMKKIQQADAMAPEPLVLSDENSLWGADVYIAVSREVPGAENTRLSGKFISKVFEGPYRNIRNWIREMQHFLKEGSLSTGKMYFYYTTCPRCAQAYGKNHVVILAELLPASRQP